MLTAEKILENYKTMWKKYLTGESYQTRERRSTLEMIGTEIFGLSDEKIIQIQKEMKGELFEEEIKKIDTRMDEELIAKQE